VLEVNEDYEDVISPPPWWVKAGRTAVALLALVGILYLSGGYQYFFLRRTSPNVQQTSLPSKVQGTVLVVPVAVHILTSTPGSERTEPDAQRLVANASNIWSQANIAFVIEDITYETVTANDLRTFDREPHSFITNAATYNPNVANLYLTRTLSGVNGLAYGGTNAIAVADYTSNLDFRTLAHEFGHLLGLPHVASPKQLMSTGTTGVELTIEEITTTRIIAQHY
jgi:hypothetical protein